VQGLRGNKARQEEAVFNKNTICKNMFLLKFKRGRAFRGHVAICRSFKGLRESAYGEADMTQAPVKRIKE